MAIISKLPIVWCSVAALLSVAAASTQSALACSRALYVGPNNQVITTRSNDWLGSQKSNLWIYPRGMKRVGDKAAGAMEWTSKYGSVTVAGWDIATIDAFNEKRLSANGLSLAEADYGKPAVNETRKPMSLTAWVQFAVDNFATVAACASPSPAKRPRSTPACGRRVTDSPAQPST